LRHPLLLLLGGIIACDYLFVPRSGIENPWIAMTGPWCEYHGANAITGYAWSTTTHGLLHNENFSIFADQAMFAGQAQNTAFYALRPGLSLIAYAFFFLPAWPATNLAIAAMAALAVGAMYFIGRRYALPPFLCVLLGASTYLLGSVSFHLADYSSHIAGPATWILASFVILTLRPWDRDADWRRFFLAHITFWFIVPFYWSNIVLYCALALMFLPQPRRLAISVALLVGCYFWRDVWSFTMNAAYGDSAAYGLTESGYLTRAVNFWLDSLRSRGILHVVQQMLQYALQAISPEPFVLVGSLGIIAFAALRSRLLGAVVCDKFLIFTLVSGIGACALVVILAPSAEARGYLAYGVPIALIISMIVIIGRADLSRTELRVISALMATLVFLQFVWVKSLIIGNPLPVCQYFVAEHVLGNVFPAFVRSLISRPVFLPFGTELQPHHLAHMNVVIADALSALMPTLKPVTTGAVDTSRKLLPSLTLGFVLLLPLAIGLVVAMRWPVVIGPFKWRAGTLAATCLGLLWLVSWAVAPIVRSDGLTHYNLEGSCRENGLAKRYVFTIPAGFKSALERHQIDEVELRGGFYRFHLNDLISVEVSRLDDAAVQSIVSSGGRFPVEGFEKLLPPNGDSTTLLLHEHFRTPPVRYLGWRRLDSGVEGCAPSTLAPLVELRGYKGGRPMLYAY
jgi:hypothetical protein